MEVKVIHTLKAFINYVNKKLNRLILLALATTLFFPTPSQSDTNHFGARGVFELDLGDIEIPLTPKQEEVKLKFYTPIKQNPTKSLDNLEILVQ